MNEIQEFEAEYAGRVVELVNPRNTSKECSVCGHTQDMPLSERTYNCPECGNIMDRDHNAAVNILQRIGQDMPKLTSVEMVA
jgi:Transposase and inactivated derivatives